ncbi:ElyC/SanA/YdcF family protein [Acinetobacter faecalis]|uniref:YdcF family protein n=1 Tax=Acinetobacter faecalis TaxID=2665161 RepID=UPI002A910A1C|nr:ElyC/SanA/YdcF family protein [Acinetobacter faecalis]MDY6537413.1 ElyC/SanA/YdcF family protein [Acinetobacter faecalis]
MAKKHLMVKLVQIASLLFVLLGCLMLFVYSPYYSKLVVKALNTFVPVEVNELAAESQKMASLSENDTLEPGSELWIARQAYLKVMETELKKGSESDLSTIQARYKILQISIINEQEEQEKDEPAKSSIPLLDVTSSSEAQAESTQAVRELLELNNSENKAAMEKYTEFLLKHEIVEPIKEEINLQTLEDVQQIQDQGSTPSNVQKMKPYAIVVLGGGLTLDKDSKTIIVNNYTKLRLEKTLEIEKQYQLPIVLSGVEAPYMQAWLKERGVDAKLLEDRSMNTCENTRFSSLLLQKKGGAPTVILVTDEYHMPRTRRLFALNGIETIPVEAPMPTQLTNWRPSAKNYDHSRRANYEMLASIRDVFLGSSDCREIP